MAKTLLALAALAVALTAAPGASSAPGDLADLGVLKLDDPDPVIVGTPLTYAIRVANFGPDDATGVTVIDRLPADVAFVSAQASNGKCERKNRKVTCKVGDLAADLTTSNAVTVTIVVHPEKAGTIANTVVVDSAENDPISFNDEAAASTTVVQSPHVSSCRGEPATVTGTPRSDRLVGTSGPDVIAAMEGNDLIFGLGDRDLICSGAGKDRVNAGTGADRVFGGVGRDRLRGLGGPDLLAGNPGADILLGAAGDDSFRGGRGFDLCYGARGVDRERGCER